MPTVTVTAQKEPEDKQRVPVSVTAVSKDTIDSAGIHIVSEAAIFAPNTFFTEWSARKLSNARFRGISSSPNNPGITTYIDGVPQLSANSSSIELLDVNQIEFVRGPQSALFGRNTLGGLVNITSARPSVSTWTGTLSVPFGNYGSWAVRGGVSGPIASDKLSVGLSFAQVDRDGFTVNDVTGNDIDSRSAFSGKAQLLWLPNNAWEGRVIFSGERARDGDYSLNDVGALRNNPFHAARDFEGRADRDVMGTTILARRASGPVVFSSTTGFLNWKTQDVTDLDYTPRPILTRDNTEKDFQFTQEIRFASAETAPVRLTDAAQLRWQSGVFLFTQSYEQDAINNYSPFVVAPFPVSQHTPRSALDDFGLGLFGQATVTFNEKLDLAAGARFDYEDKSALLENFFEPLIAPPARVEADKSFSNVSPQSVDQLPGPTREDAVRHGWPRLQGRRLQPGVARGQRGVRRGVQLEHRRRRENALGRRACIGECGRLLHRLGRSAAEHSQPRGAGAVLHLQRRRSRQQGRRARAWRPARRRASICSHRSATRTRGSPRAASRAASTLKATRSPTRRNTPPVRVCSTHGCSGQRRSSGRADAVFYGSFQYNDQNSLGQEAYSLVNLRLGVTGRFLMGELLIRNAFDTRYIPLAFPYPSFAPSGFMGEMGAPRTVSLSAGIRF